ncbi:hypothetical protein HRbin33_01521 [bacterium HR33]|nr:hypothetical protein HRbin33_01521 [bacterium HR33]
MHAGTTRLILACAVVAASTGFDPLEAQREGSQAQSQGLPTIEQRTSGMRKMDGFFPLYWDSLAGRLYMEISRFNTEILHITGIAAGLGSNDIGIDRGQLAGSSIVIFERVGPKVLMVQPNYDFRATSDNPAEVRAVRDAFARSVLWGFTAAAQTGGRVLVDITDYLLRDPGIAQRLRPGQYRLDPSRSSVYLAMTMNFPQNTETEVELTYVLQPGAGGGGFGGFGPPGPGRQFFEGVGSVAATAEAASIRIHYSWVQLPEPGYRPRKFDPRAGYGAVSYVDYAAPADGNQWTMVKRFIRRHRLQKRDPSAPVSEPVKPIVYYLDPGVPEPIRSALLEGASWWNQAFEAAGYRNAFRVEIRPDSINPHDVRYNVINWVHRSTRGWSTGATVTDPRTGEIIKGVVTLGSLRYRQDYMIAEGLLSPYRDGDQIPAAMREWALARIRQLAAHEVGHTLGLAHNYYDSERGRISVMDYPHPWVTLRPDGSLDYSEVYERGIGEWDSVAIAYGYQDFPPGTDEDAALRKILDDAWERDIRFLTNQDISANPRADQWSNGTDPAAELRRMMEVRRAALSRFGENAIRRGDPMALMEEVLVPLYLHHRYQVEAAASAVGGLHYIYAIRGDGRTPTRPVPASEQRAALSALMATIRPAALRLPDAVIRTLPPRPMGYGYHRELFPRYTGPMFDVISPAVAAAQLTIGNLLDETRAARLVEQHALDSRLPSLQEVLDSLEAATFGVRPADGYEAEIARATQRVLVEELIRLATRAEMPQVRAIAANRLQKRMNASAAVAAGDEATVAHHQLLARDIKRILEQPAEPYRPLAAPTAPPGAPIGEPAMEWLRPWDWFCSEDWRP